MFLLGLFLVVFEDEGNVEGVIIFSMYFRGDSHGFARKSDPCGSALPHIQDFDAKGSKS
jgi:hypothetical protein